MIPTQESFYSRDELATLGLASFGEDVRISRKTSFYNSGSIRLGNHVRIDDFVILAAGVPGIVLGDYIHISCLCVVHGSAGFTMEDYTGLSAHTVVYSESDDFSGQSLTFPFFPRRFKPGYLSGRVEMRKHSIVGTNCTLMPGVILKEGSAVGAHSLVTKSCEPWTIYAGVPATARKARSRDVLDLTRQFHEELLQRQQPR